MTSIPRGTLATLAFTSTVWLAATPAAADDVDTCGKASGDEAIAACTRAINSGRYSGRQLAALFNNRCSEWNGKQERQGAIADCSQAIRLKPDHADAFYNRGNTYNAKGPYDRAIEDYNQAIRLNPNDACAFFNRGVSWERKN
jgi:tetratricopeptide (TPR) repeat protein